MFIDRLIRKTSEKKNVSVLGLDPQIQYVPSFIKEKMFSSYGENLKGAAFSLLEFNKRIIDSVSDIIGVVKLQLACYEMYGIDGINVFLETINYAKKNGMLVIADGKRNDIGSSAKCYSDAFLGKTYISKEVSQSVFDVDALTVNGYLGHDGIDPFVKDCLKYKKGIFILVKTSNKSSSEIQDIWASDNSQIYQKMAKFVSEWGEDLIGKHGYSSIGAVVGATYPKESQILRKLMKHTFFLVPGYGTQGGTSKDIASSFNNDGLGSIVNASRSIMCAYKTPNYNAIYRDEEFDLASREESIRMRDDLNNNCKVSYLEEVNV